jgi:TolA-binding protein
MKVALEDLSALSRRDELSEPERQRLDVLLQSSADARLFHGLGRRFDAEDPSLPIADAASEAVVDALLNDPRLLSDLQRRGSAKRRTLPRSTWLIAAAALFVASLAGAVIGVQRLRSERASIRAAAALPSVSAPAGRAVGQAVLPAGPVSGPIQEHAAPELSAEPLPTHPTPASAAELLSAAGRARRIGQPKQALELLQTLRSHYPNSPEASASEITLGKLQLETGAVAVALGHFDAYLQRSPSGALTPEALWGRAQALTQLGRSSEAQQSLSQLLQRYPASPYASAARAKLGSAAAGRP